MFEGVKKKLELAEYFLSNLKRLEHDAGGNLTYVKLDKRNEMRANLDGFLFEIISAKEFFLQGIIDSYGLTSAKLRVTKRKLLIKLLDSKGLNDASRVVTRIDELLDGQRLRPDQKLHDDKDSWLWRLNHYRNSATHRELLRFGSQAEIYLDKELFSKLQQEKIVIKTIFEGQEKDIPPEVKKIKIPLENIKTYLFKDPVDVSKGNVDIEVIPYCEQSLERMKDFLEQLYSELSI